MKTTKVATILGLILAGAALAGSATGRHAETSCLAAVIHHEERAEGVDGVSRSSTYHDRFQRCGDRVYLSRIRNEGRATTPPAHGGHGPSDLAALPRRLTRLPDGTASVAILDAEHGQVIDVGSGSFGTLRVDPSFERAFALVDAQSLATLMPARSPKPWTDDGATDRHGDAQWRSRVDGTKYVRVLWSEQRGIALAMQSGSLDGAVREEITVEIEAGDATLAPASWRAAEHLPHVDLADLTK